MGETERSGDAAGHLISKKIINEIDLQDYQIILSEVSMHAVHWTQESDNF